ncbi:MAG: fatty acid--CoA ligase family protein [Actinomycetota bacterium]|nr:fatty acid--CoA ligase family protein [Actinomycetota bacterium]
MTAAPTENTSAQGLHLPSWLQAIVALDPAAPVLQFEGSWRPWSFLASGMHALDDAMVRHGWGEGSMVGIVIRNRPEIVRAMIGTLGTGRCLVTLSSVVPPATLAAEIVRLGLPVVVATEADWTPELRAAVAEAGSLGLRFDDDERPAHVVVPAGTRRDDAATTRAGVAVQMLTSGTTGAPKRVDLLYTSLGYEIVSTSRYSASADLAAPSLASGVSIVWNPMLHIGGLRGLVTNLVAGRRVSLLERFSVEAWAALVAEHRPRAIALVPSAMRMVLDANLPREALAGVDALVSGTAPLSPETKDEWEQRFGIPVLVVYGATEFGGVAGWTIRDWRAFGDTKRGSVGRANEGVEIRIVDQGSGEAVPAGSSGLLEVRSQQLGQDGWVRTTDLARMDDDGFIWIEGRTDDVIIRGGFKVATNAVADTLRRHPAVSDACVIGVPDERLGQVPAAGVELRAGATLSSAELAAWAREQLSSYQVPVVFLIVDELPRTPSMKVSQPGLRALLDAAG